MNSTKQYVVTKEFTGGILKGIRIEETTPVKFEVGFICEKPCGGSSPYRILDVQEIQPRPIPAANQAMAKALATMQRGGAR